MERNHTFMNRLTPPPHSREPPWAIGRVVKGYNGESNGVKSRGSLKAFRARSGPSNRIPLQS